MKKKALLILGIMIVAVLVVVLVIQPRPKAIPIPGIEGQQSVYLRVHLQGAEKVADYMAKGVAKMPNAAQNNITAEGLPTPVLDDIAKSFPGYKISSATMFVTDNVTTYEVVLVKGPKTKTLIYEVFEDVQAVFTVHPDMTKKELITGGPD
jgi:hypothetical protein